MLDPRPYLTTRAIGREVEIHDVIDSTNARAAVLARAGAGHGLAVIAGSQTAGRGRLGRVWDSPPDAGAYVSFIVRPNLALKDTPLLTLTAGLALSSAVVALSGADVALKWPNDLLATSTLRKVAGILVEMVSGQAIVGIGVNVRAVPRPPLIADYATSIESVSGRVIDRAELIAAIASELEAEIERLESTGAGPLIARWSARAAGRGEPVRIGDVEGVLEGVGPDGALLVRTPGGVRAIYAGDLRLSGAPEPQDR